MLAASNKKLPHGSDGLFHLIIKDDTHKNVWRLNAYSSDDEKSLFRPFRASFVVHSEFRIIRLYLQQGGTLDLLADSIAKRDQWVCRIRELLGSL